MKYLAIGPGAMGFFVFMGALYKLQETGKLDDLEEISGSSAGSLLGFFYLLTKRDLIKTFDFTLDAPIKQVMKPSIKTLFKDYGLVPVSRVRKLLSEACLKFTNKNDITFSELLELVPIKLHVAAFCVDLKRTDYFSIDKTPHMSVLDALCMSIAVPFLFSASKFNDWHYVDGGAAEALPCAPFIGYTPQDILAIQLEFSVKKKEIKDIKAYGLEVMYAILHMRSQYDVPILNLNLGDMDMFDFGMESESKIRMFMTGQKFSLPISN
jgi:predicted acylesterase/phospholipase RssA